MRINFAVDPRSTFPPTKRVTYSIEVNFKSARIYYRHAAIPPCFWIRQRKVWSRCSIGFLIPAIKEASSILKAPRHSNAAALANRMRAGARLNSGCLSFFFFSWFCMGFFWGVVFMEPSRREAHADLSERGDCHVKSDKVLICPPGTERLDILLTNGQRNKTGRMLGETKFLQGHDVCFSVITAA